MTEAIKRFIKIYLTPILKTHGFKRRGNRFYKKNDDLTFSISLHIDREYVESGAFFYITVGIYSDKFETLMKRELNRFPIGYDNLYQGNTRDLLGLETNEATFHVNRSGENDELLQRIKETVERVMLILSKIDSFDSFVLHCLQHNYLVHHEDLLRYLAAKNDDELTAFYFGKIKERLQKITDDAYVCYVQKFESFR